MTERRTTIGLALLTAVTLFLSTLAQAQNTLPASHGKERVIFMSGKLTLVGFLFKPDGQGPFPGLIWNHGSERMPDRTPQFDAVGDFRTRRVRGFRADATWSW